MPGVSRLAIPDLVKECRALGKLGILAVALFPKLDARPEGRGGHGGAQGGRPDPAGRPGGQEGRPGADVMTDIALDPYTAHGHDGVLTPDGRDVDNDRTVGILSGWRSSTPAPASTWSRRAT
jgi:porphobilinogen synthase